MKIISILFFLITSLMVQAQVNVTVMAVHDGDSYAVKFPDGRRIWVRLWGIDCPEVRTNLIMANQPYGVAAGDYVRGLIKGKTVYLDTLRRDMYNRLVVKVRVDSFDLTRHLLERGCGWAYDYQMTDEEHDELIAIQRAARAEKAGLWALPGRKLRPATFRKRNNIAVLEPKLYFPTANFQP